jgi:hypothetical protein
MSKLTKGMRWWTAMLLFAFSMSASARDLGRWLCQCDIPPAGSPTSSIELAEGPIAFAKSTNIVGAAPTGPRDRYIAGDEFVICNGTLCIKLVWIPYSTPFEPKGPSFSDNPSSGYKNSGRAGGTGGSYIPSTWRSTTYAGPAPTLGVLAGGYEIQAFGHNEWFDVYSNGNLIYSTTREFVVDRVEVRPFGGAGPLVVTAYGGGAFAFSSFTGGLPGCRVNCPKPQ